MTSGTIGAPRGPRAMFPRTISALAATALFLTTHATHAESCEISGRATFPLVVEVGTSSFNVNIEGAMATAQPPTQGKRSSVHVKGVLEFEGHSEQVPYRAKALATAADEMVQLGGASQIGSMRASGPDAIIDVDLGGGVLLRRLRLPCNELTLDPQDRAQPLPHPPCHGSYWFTLGQRFVEFHSEPGRGERVLVELSRPDDRLIVCEVDKQRAWLRVSIADYVHVIGGRVTGWVSQSQLRRIEGGVGFTGGSSMGRATLGYGRIAAAGDYQGPARLMAGSRVHTAANGPSWASVREDRAVVEVVLWNGSDWARIIDVPGLGVIAHAWIPRTAVVLP